MCLPIMDCDSGDNLLSVSTSLNFTKGHIYFIVFHGNLLFLISNPDAVLCPPPPYFFASLATSALPSERRET